METAEVLAQVKRIQIIANRQVNDLLAGEYLSVFKGRGMEFDEVREYVPGDDIRTIDWNVTARTNVPHVKRYAEERELTILFLVDVSRSGIFGSGDRAKLDIDGLGSPTHKALKWVKHEALEMKGFSGKFTLWAIA